MMLKALFISALALGAYAQVVNDNNRVTVTRNCGVTGNMFTWCAIVDNGSVNAMTIFWRNNSVNDDSVDIAVGLPGLDDFDGWCGWGLSETPDMLNSSVIVFGANIDSSDPESFDRQVGATRVAPTASAEAQRQNAALLGPAVVPNVGWGAIITRPRMVAGLAASRQFMGSVNMIVACGNGTTFGFHDRGQARFIINVDNGELIDPPMQTDAPGDDGASHLQVASAIVIAVVGSIAVALF